MGEESRDGPAAAIVTWEGAEGKGAYRAAVEELSCAWARSERINLAAELGSLSSPNPAPPSTPVLDRIPKKRAPPKHRFSVGGEWHKIHVLGDRGGLTGDLATGLAQCASLWLKEKWVARSTLNSWVCMMKQERRSDLHNLLSQNAQLVCSWVGALLWYSEERSLTDSAGKLKKGWVGGDVLFDGIIYKIN